VDFDYSVRVSSRAKRMSLKISAVKGLEVVVPIGFDHAQIEPFVRQKQSWVKRHLAKYTDNQKLENFIWPPEELDLIGIGRKIQIHYRASMRDGYAEISQTGDAIIIRGDKNDQDLITQVLVKYLIVFAKSMFIPKLECLAQQKGIKINRVNIRAQKTRWGSCSSKGNINLNYKLLFLPKEHVHYIMMHELAHTFHLNHSPQYWAVLHDLLPNARHLDKQLRQSSRRVPHWLDH